MPLGYERLNERSQRPNQLINFIKPLTTSAPADQKIAQDFLEQIAAQCYPVMKRDHISVMTLEEFPPNSEFLGRNFNAGECIQLVLKDKAGRWLSFKFVQMVMMHELAHCKQMNHSKFFWQVRNKYADHMKDLWAKKYHGEGLWGRGQDLSSGVFVHDSMPDQTDIPEHLCGGTYRSAKGKKRKRAQDDNGEKSKSTYAERQQKRIAKKFGAHGEGHGVGEDELLRTALEKGHRHPGKPRVANSKRGRELRASAALARFESAKERQEEERKTATQTIGLDDDSETDSDDEYADGQNILDTLERIKDQRGRDLYKVCGDEGDQSEGGKEELEELLLISGKSTATKDVMTPAKKKNDKMQKTNDSRDHQMETSKSKGAPMWKGNSSGGRSKQDLESSDTFGAVTNTTSTPTSYLTSNVIACPVCSLENESTSPTCIACSNVLQPSLMRNHWRCKSNECDGSSYINSGDAGRCGVCAAPKPAHVESLTMGLIGADVLRWD